MTDNSAKTRQSKKQDRENQFVQQNYSSNNDKYLYICSTGVAYLTLKALRHGSHSFTCNYTNACLYLISVYRMAPPQTGVADF